MRLDGQDLSRRATRRRRAESALERDLRAAVAGEVRFDEGHRAALRARRVPSPRAAAGRGGPFDLAGGMNPHRGPGEHCHQAATVGLDAEPELLRRVGMGVDVLDAGRCGMAGAFGFRRAHFEVSRRIAERRPLPAVRQAAPDAVIVADGFPCRKQIEQLTDRRALHLAAVLAPAGAHA